MTLVVTQNNQQIQLEDSFVQVCGLLRDMLDVLGSRDEPIPLTQVSDATLQDAIMFHKTVCVVDNVSVDEFPADAEAFFATKTPTYVVQLWSFADFMNYEYLQTLTAMYLANLIRYCEPSRVAELFDIQKPTVEELEQCMLQHPFLREI